jgi:tetratricopeptide (TPR) repeat protein
LHDEPTRALPLLEEALRLARIAGDRILEGRALNNLGLLHLAAGRSEEALGCFRTSLQLRAAVGYRRGVVINEHNIAEVHFRRGDTGKASMGFARSREIAERIGWPRGIAINDVFLRYLEGGTVEAIEHAAEHALSLGERESYVAGVCLVARRHHELGERDAAREAIAALADHNGGRWANVVRSLAPALPLP